MSEPIQSIAQNNYILATQQEVSHDNTLSGNGTVDSPLGVVPGYDETVLFSGAFLASKNSVVVLPEPITNFDKLRIYAARVPSDRASVLNEFLVGGTQYFVEGKFTDSNNTVWWDCSQIVFDNNISATVQYELRKNIGTTSFTTNTGTPLTITRIVGVNRKQ